ncbi:hypothetical protein [Francisella sp. XLW-1]|uniref:hypothetical protein n=1 Tax=Francisella sp. XLW-1 TaxID=2610887 RepID=UPI00123D4555|nr:hypothetical protein [Francisella sp. XLW-1]
MNEELKKIYNYRRLDKVEIDGITISSAIKGERVKLSQRAFITSYEDGFDTIANRFCSLLSLSSASLNKCLVIIHEDNSADLYLNPPITQAVNLKTTTEKGTAVFSNDIFDISEVFFKDSITDLTPEETDKIIFIFREGFRFGIFYNLTKRINKSSLGKEIGSCYKELYFHEQISFLNKDENFNIIIEDGWFPFIKLINSEFNEIIKLYQSEKEASKRNYFLQELVAKKFDSNKILSLTNNWWQKEQFSAKKKFIEAGINCFLEGNYISCLSTLYPIIEGIVGIDYFNQNGRKPKFKELVEYIQEKADIKYSCPNSLAYPREFYDYLNKVVFKNFNLETGDVDLSRHSVLHGYASEEDFNMTRSLQLILTLDQINFYL